MEANQKFQFRTIKRRVFCTTTAAISRGYGLVYDLESTATSAATVADRARGKYVCSPSATKYQNFAGVLLNDKPAGAQWVDIAEPGSECQIYLGDTSATIGGYVGMDCGVGAGAFYAGGLKGLGSAIVLTTVTAAGLVNARLIAENDLGLLQRLTPVAAGGAIVAAPIGATLVNGTAVNDAHITCTLANGTVIGQKKMFLVTNTIGNSKNLVVTVTSGVQLDGTTALNSMTFNSANERSILEWMGNAWKLIHSVGTTLA